MTNIDLNAVRSQLQGLRDRLVHQLAELGSGESGDLRADLQFGDSFADAAAATAERTEVLGLADTLKTQLEGVDRAIKRVTDGGYGICVSCGKEISAARLEARPESIYCIDC